jgi:hypothetical protein
MNNHSVRSNRAGGESLRRWAFAAALILSCGLARASELLPVTPLMADDNPPAPAQPTPNPNLDELDYRKSLAPTSSQMWQYMFSFTAGYSYVHFNDSDTFYNESGPYFDGDFAFPLANLDAPIVGFGVSVTSHWENQDFANSGTLYSEFSLISFEGRIAYPIPARSNEGLFFLPRLGGGLLLNNYQIEKPAGVNDYTSYHNGFAAEIRPSAQVGYRWSENASAGIEASYMAGWGGFGNLGSMVTEARIGLVLSLRY